MHLCLLLVLGANIGTVIAPHADVKLFVTAPAEIRARRRHAEMVVRDPHVSFIDILSDIHARDERDMGRADAPLKPAEDALLLDNSNLTVEESVAQVLAWWQQRNPFSEHPTTAARP